METWILGLELPPFHCYQPLSHSCRFFFGGKAWVWLKKKEPKKPLMILLDPKIYGSDEVGAYRLDKNIDSSL